jgi:hypothetical protein
LYLALHFLTRSFSPCSCRTAKGEHVFVHNFDSFIRPRRILFCSWKIYNWMYCIRV